MLVDWGEPLTPRVTDIRRSCTCADAEGHSGSFTCKHAAALVYVFAHAIDADPAVLLRFRGWTGHTDAETEPRHGSPSASDADPWVAGSLPRPRPVRPLPVAAVLKRLGPSGLRTGAGPLEDALLPAYEAFSGLVPRLTTPDR